MEPTVEDRVITTRPILTNHSRMAPQGSLGRILRVVSEPTKRYIVELKLPEIEGSAIHLALLELKDIELI